MRTTAIVAGSLIFAYGLRNSLWATDPGVIDRFTGRVRNGGLLKINDSHIGFLPYLPTHGGQVRDSGLCGSCHTLITSALGPHGEKIARFPEQVPYQEWQHSDYATKQT